MNDKSPIHLAIDLGASGGRVLAGRFDERGFHLDEVHRFPNGGIHCGKRFVWNILEQWEQIQHGLGLAANAYGDRIQSVGADTWGVDYVLLDRNDDLVGPCFNYRDPRTRGMVERAFERLPRSEIFAETGIQFMEINTAYQLLAMREEKSPLLDVVDQFLMVPDFVHWLLSGAKVNEYTNASTTQLLNATTRDWSERILQAFELPRSMFSTPIQPGAILGTPLSHVCEQTGLSKETQIVVPATHDTGSAVLAVPADSFASSSPDWCYISCGTWSLMGAELSAPVLTPRCAELNFTNEGGVSGSTRLLKNIPGLWVVQQCREQWKREGNEYSWGELVRLAEAARPFEALIDPDASDFVAPNNMPEAVVGYCQRTGQNAPSDVGSIIRCALESLVVRYRVVLGNLEELVGHSFSTIHMVGGGVQNQMLCQLAADACNRAVIAGPVEATALGNVMMQVIASGGIGSVQEARSLVRSAEDIRQYEPNHDARWDEAHSRLTKLVNESAST